ncbi:MAG TPA: DUF418 domain-containing protein [Arenimonas sp.]|nr:DUF418 domain-containing protein [Arenimonas sp.]
MEQHLRLTPEPRLVWFTEEIARIALTIGHLCLVNLLLSAALGQRLLSPFKAAGRTAFTLYLMQTLIAGWLLFPGFGLGLFAQYGWAAMALMSLAIIAAQVVMANVWLRWFAMGPVEWPRPRRAPTRSGVHWHNGPSPLRKERKHDQAPTSRRPHLGRDDGRRLRPK